MSELLDFVRANYPQYKDVSDDELTAFLGEKFPGYLKEPDFAEDYARVVTRPEREESKQARARTLESAAAAGIAPMVPNLIREPIIEGVNRLAKLAAGNDLVQ